MNEGEVRRKLIQDRDAGFVALVRWTSSDLYRGLLRLTGDPHLAQDLSQDAYIRAWTALRKYPDGRISDMKLRGWLWTIALNRARTHLGRLALPDERPSPVGDIGDAVVDRDECERLLKLIPEPARTAVVLRHVVGLPYADVALVTGRPEGTVKSDVHRAIKNLQREARS